MREKTETKRERETDQKDRFTFISGPAAELAKEVNTESRKEFL